jgi:AcrR family transcriptional regulator
MANDEREQRILDAAETLIIHYGYDKTTVSDIAHTAGVSKGAIYLHFDSKDTLFEALLQRELKRYRQAWIEQIQAHPDGGTMAGIYKSVLYALQRNAFMLAIFKQDTHVLGSYLRKSGTAFQSQRGTSIRAEFLKMMQQAGAIKADVDTRIYAHIMNMLAYGLVSMDQIMDDDDIPPLDDLIEGIGDLMDKALTPADREQANRAGKAVLQQIMTHIDDTH